MICETYAAALVQSIVLRSAPHRSASAPTPDHLSNRHSLSFFDQSSRTGLQISPLFLVIFDPQEFSIIFVLQLLTVPISVVQLPAESTGKAEPKNEAETNRKGKPNGKTEPNNSRAKRSQSIPPPHHCRHPRAVDGKGTHGSDSQFTPDGANSRGARWRLSRVFRSWQDCWRIDWRDCLRTHIGSVHGQGAARVEMRNLCDCEPCMPRRCVRLASFLDRRTIYYAAPGKLGWCVSLWRVTVDHPKTRASKNRLDRRRRQTQDRRGVVRVRQPVLCEHRKSTVPLDRHTVRIALPQVVGATAREFQVER